MDKNELILRTKIFAHSCVKLAITLPNNLLGNHISGQLIRCSTSVAANYRAANLAQTQKSFISKLSIVIEESDECIFWLEFIRDERLILLELLNAPLKESKELTSIFVSSRKTLTKNNK